MTDLLQQMVDILNKPVMDDLYPVADDKDYGLDAKSDPERDFSIDLDFKNLNADKEVETKHKDAIELVFSFKF